MKAVNSSLFRKLFIVAAVLSIGLGGLCTRALASDFDGFTEIRTGFSVSGVDNVSYDGLGYDAFKAFASITSTDILQINSFTGGLSDTMLQAFMLSEVAYFDGSSGYANKFGVLNEAGEFSTLLDSGAAGPGSLGELMQSADSKFTFALQSPEGLFSSIDAANPDKAAHFLVKEVVRDAVLQINPVDRNGGDPVTFSFLAGDLILFVEDMLAAGNTQYLGIPVASDFDYNDMVVVVRRAQIPEPSTFVLLASGLLACRFRRSRR